MRPVPSQGVRHILKLSGAESLTECNRELCGVQDCCGDKAYVVTVQEVVGSGHGKRKRRPACRPTVSFWRRHSL